MPIPEIGAVAGKAVVPLILTCELNLSLTEQFAESYASIAAHLEAPITVVDVSASCRLSSAYWNLIGSLNSQTIYIHAPEPGMSVFDSVQEAYHLLLSKGLDERPDVNLFLFMEDDIVFSSQFLSTLRSIHLSRKTGLVTLYEPDFGYPARLIAPWHFCGAQCILFPRHCVAELVQFWSWIKRIPPGADNRWARYLGGRGYHLEHLGASFVQHLGWESRIGSPTRHKSDIFVP